MYCVMWLMCAVAGLVLCVSSKKREFSYCTVYRNLNARGPCRARVLKLALTSSLCLERTTVRGNAHSLPSDMFLDCLKEIRINNFREIFRSATKEKYSFGSAAAMTLPLCLLVADHSTVATMNRTN